MHNTLLVSVINLAGIIQYVSEEHESLLGYDANELIGKSVFEMVHPEDCNSVVGSFCKMIQFDDATYAAHRFRHKNGEWVNFHSVGIPVVLSSGLRNFIIFSRQQGN